MDTKEIKKLQYEIDGIKTKKRIFIIFGIASLIIGLALIIVPSIFFGLGLQEMEANPDGSVSNFVFSSIGFGLGLTFGIVLLIVGTALLIVQGAVFNHQIRKREVLIIELSD